MTSAICFHKRLLGQLLWLIKLVLHRRSAHASLAALQTLKLPVKDAGAYVCGVDKSDEQFQINLYLRPVGHIIELTVSSDVFAQRDWILRELALRALERNPFAKGPAFGLKETSWGHALILTHRVDMRLCGTASLVAAAEQLMGRMRDSLHEWYGDQLVERGDGWQRRNRKKTRR